MVVGGRRRRNIDVENGQWRTIREDANCLDFGEVVVRKNLGRVEVDERDVESDEESEAAAVTILTIYAEKVVSREARWVGVAIPQFGFLETTHTNVVSRQEITKLSRRVFETVAIPLDDDGGR